MLNNKIDISSKNENEDKNELDLDLCDVNSANSIIAHVCSMLEKEENKFKRVNLILPDIDLNINQIESIRLIIESNNCILNRINTSSTKTKEALDNIGIITTGKENDTYNMMISMLSGDTNENNDESYEDSAIKKLEEMLNEQDSEQDKKARQVITKEDLEILNMPTKYVKQTLRSGQYLSFDGNVFIMGDCNAGSEVQAAGDITVWGKLLGVCHAGKNGNKKARIRALNLNPIQIRIANLYTRKPDGANINLKEKRNIICVEEAMVIDDEINIVRY